MYLQDYLQIIIFFAALIALTPLAGNYMASVFTGKNHFMMPVLGWFENLSYKLSGTDPQEEQTWKQYAISLLLFNLTGIIFLFGIQLFQSYLPMNPQGLPDVSWHTAINTAVSFVTNTNWQGYAGETTLSYFVQMIGLTVQNFVSAATGFAVLLALTRGISKKVTDRIGNSGSILWSTITSATGNGSVNSMHDSLTPVAGMIAMLNIMLGEIIFSAVGSGLYGMILFIILTVFIAGLMVGRTPEYFGKKIESFEIKMSIVAILIPNLTILLLTALALGSRSGLSGIGNPGPHGLSEILYAYCSAAGNNGSAFAGLDASNPFYNLTLSLAMLAGRFGVIIPVLAISGSMTGKKSTPPSSGTFKTDNILFLFLLIAVI